MNNNLQLRGVSLSSIQFKFFFEMKVDKDLSSNKIIGIKEIHDYLHGKISLFKSLYEIRPCSNNLASLSITNLDFDI